ncbi:MAG: hypothetical protein GC168_15430 [Candidatus Hydrogenedens sp.]|nr:hypothetical protein [Candidatus Hydrogenedens sp.]
MGLKSSQNREMRNALRGALQYTCAGPDDEGTARWLNVSRTGAAISMGRYLRPGREITLVFDSPLAYSHPHEVRARIIWCRPAGGGIEFTAGLEIYRDTPEMALDFAALGYAARRQSNNATGAPVTQPVWPGFTHGEGTRQPTVLTHCAQAV